MLLISSGEIFTLGLDGPYCSFDDYDFLNKMPNSTRVAVSKPHCALQKWNFA